MTMLPSPGSRYIEPDGKSAPTVTLMVIQLTSAGLYDLVPSGVAALEWADVGGTGNYDIIAAGTSPTATRLVARQLAGGNALLYPR
jgi:hypothetical protein